MSKFSDFFSGRSGSQSPISKGDDSSAHERRMVELCAISELEAIEALKSSPKGLSAEEAERRLDEYGANGDALGKRIQEIGPAFALISGVPHAIPPEYTQGVECFSITNGPRQVAPLRTIGHRHVIVEIDLHPKTLGVREIVESEFGAVLRSLA